MLNELNNASLNNFVLGRKKSSLKVRNLVKKVMGNFIAI